MYKINLLPVWLLFLTQVATLPTMVDEVVPGPGLPSLASLNITSAELFAMPDPPAVACYNYLNNFGTTACAANGHYTEGGGITGLVKMLHPTGEDVAWENGDLRVFLEV
ncbi:hypothetical protein BKA61DRAFT_570334 [Leptodontidium sp. MPI-SDFR-AT-0119]|nr:hypothetical protein BKA61DRAFT_570334 [Leptodontidium sp. MPI-SDFR-AT-0119]